MCICGAAAVFRSFLAVTRSARVHALECHSQTQHTHTHVLKMEVRDQSSDGQVGESERYLMDRGEGNKEQERGFGVVCLNRMLDSK